MVSGLDRFVSVCSPAPLTVRARSSCRHLKLVWLSSTSIPQTTVTFASRLRLKCGASPLDVVRWSHQPLSLINCYQQRGAPRGLRCIQAAARAWLRLELLTSWSWAYTITNTCEPFSQWRHSPVCHFPFGSLCSLPCGRRFSKWLSKVHSRSTGRR